MTLIDKDQLLRDLNTGMNIIEMMQTVIDAKEVEPKTGQWLRYGEDGWPNDKETYYWQCDQCLETIVGKVFKPFQYCPYCGTRMEVEHETD